MYIYIYIYIYIFIDIITHSGGLATAPSEAPRTRRQEKGEARLGGKRSHQKSPPRKPSWIFSGMFQRIVSGIVQRIFTCQRYFPKDCHFIFPVHFTGYIPMDVHWHLATEFHVCDFRRVIFCPEIIIIIIIIIIIVILIVVIVIVIIVILIVVKV